MDPRGVCPVCGDCDGRPLRHHYGGTCCLKCRSFFLRTHKRTKNSPLKCDSGGNCLNTPKGKLLCQKCRLDRCLEIGMDPKLILSEDEKRERFKRYFKKKEEEQKKLLKQQAKNPASLLGPALPRMELVNSGSNASLQFAPVTRLINTSPIWLQGNPAAQSTQRVLGITDQTQVLHPAWSSGGSFTPTLIPMNLTSGVVYLVPVPILQSQPIQFQLMLSPPQPSTSSDPCSGRLDSIKNHGTDCVNDGFDVSSILESFASSMGKLSAEAKSAQDLIKIHKNLLPMSLQTFTEQLDLFPPLLCNFASSQPSFRSLSPEDQEVLLKINVPLYLQFITGRYLTAKSGVEQLTWVLGENVFAFISDKTDDLTAILIDEFVWEQFIFRSSEYFSIYLEYLSLIETFFNFPQKFNGLIANCLLYHTTENMKQNLQNPEKVESLFSRAQTIVEKELNLSSHQMASLDLSVLIFALTQMTKVFKLMQANKNATSHAPTNFYNSLTVAEENWLSNKFERVQIQFKSVRPSEMMVREVMKLFSGLTSVSPKNTSVWFAMRMERVKRTLRDQDAFQNLSAKDQKWLIKKNLFQATTISILRANLADTAASQLKSFIGIITYDDTSSNNVLSGIEGASSMTAFQMQKLLLNGKRLDPVQVAYISELLRDVTGLITNDQSFQILILLALFNTEGLPQSDAFQSIFDMEKIYHRFLKQKLMTSSRIFTDTNQVQIALNKLKVLAKLYEKFLADFNQKPS